MKKTVSAMEARRKFGELLEDAYRGDVIVIERAGRTMGALISPDELRRIEQKRDRLNKFFEDVREQTKGVSAEEVEREVARAIKEVRSRKRLAARRSA